MNVRITHFVRTTSSGYAASRAVPPANPPALKLHTNTRQNYRGGKRDE